MVISETNNQALYLALLFGFCCGAFLLWAILLVSPALLKVRQRKLEGKLRELETTYASLEEELSQITRTKTKIREAKTAAPTPPTSENEGAVDKERQRIAYELHDDTVQRMAAVRLRLEEFSFRLDKPEHIMDLQALGEEMNQIMKSLRFVIYGLPQPQFENGSFSALIRDFLVTRLNRVAAKTVALNLRNEEREFFLSVPVKKELYNLVQEAVQNSLKHSIGFHLQLNISWSTSLEIEIQDNGQGYVRQAETSTGLGTYSMEERAKTIGAVISFLPSTYGTLVRIVLPDTNLK